MAQSWHPCWVTTIFILILHICCLHMAKAGFVMMWLNLWYSVSCTFAIKTYHRHVELLNIGSKLASMLGNYCIYSNKRHLSSYIFRMVLKSALGHRNFLYLPKFCLKRVSSRTHELQCLRCLYEINDFCFCFLILNLCCYHTM